LMQLKKRWLVIIVTVVAVVEIENLLTELRFYILLRDASHPVFASTEEKIKQKTQNDTKIVYIIIINLTGG